MQLILDLAQEKVAITSQKHGAVGFLRARLTRNVMNTSSLGRRTFQVKGLILHRMRLEGLFLKPEQLKKHMGTSVAPERKQSCLDRYRLIDQTQGSHSTGTSCGATWPSSAKLRKQ